MAFAGVIVPAAGGLGRLEACGRGDCSSEWRDWDVCIREKPVDMCKYIRQRAFYVRSLPGKE